MKWLNVLKDGLLGSERKNYRVVLPDGNSKKIIHRGTYADRGVLKQIFKKKDYDICNLRRAGDLVTFYKSIVGSGRVPLIVDAGANIGASAFWFSMTYPESHIVCFEPDRTNFELLTLNTLGLDVELHRAAIGAVDGSVDLIDPGEGEWGYQTIPNPNGLVEMVSLNRIVIEKAEQDYEPFLIKIDIEGGESELFSKHIDWIDKFPVLIIELHDWLLPQKRTATAFLKAIAQLDRDFVYIRENIFSIKNNIIEPDRQSSAGS